MKINKALAIAAVLSLTFAASAFAANGSSSTVDENGGTVGASADPKATVKPSKGVTVIYMPESVGKTYTIGAKHTSGTKIYGSSSGDTKIYMKDASSFAATDLPDAPAENASADFSSWTNL